MSLVIHCDCDHNYEAKKSGVQSKTKLVYLVTLYRYLTCYSIFSLITLEIFVLFDICLMLVPSLAYSLILKLEAICCSETSLILEGHKRNTPGYHSKSFRWPDTVYAVQNFTILRT
jgi:hypothetical protein